MGKHSHGHRLPCNLKSNEDLILHISMCLIINTNMNTKKNLIIVQIHKEHFQRFGTIFETPTHEKWYHINFYSGHSWSYQNQRYQAYGNGNKQECSEFELLDVGVQTKAFVHSEERDTSPLPLSTGASVFSWVFGQNDCPIHTLVANAIEKKTPQSSTPACCCTDSFFIRKYRRDGGTE